MLRDSFGGINHRSVCFMPVEIERKFRAIGDGWKKRVAKTRHIRQAYLTKNPQISIRICIDGTESATLTIKTAKPGIERHEYEYPIPVADAEELLDRREGVVIRKVRHLIPIGDLTWEVDVFEGENTGLIVAEVELDRADRVVEYPPWLGEEVTHDRRFYNADLARHPYAQWVSNLTRPPRNMFDLPHRSQT